MIDPVQFRLLVVRPALEEIDLWSPVAEELVLGTAAQESRLTYLRQIGGGPALGLFQMESATHDDIWSNYLRYNSGWSKTLRHMTTTRQAMDWPSPDEMVWNLKYAAAMCRIHYVRKPGALPKTLEGQAAYWKAFYNTILGKGTVAHYIGNYKRIIGGQ